MRVRPYAGTDAAAVAEFENGQLAAVGIEPRTSVDEVRWWFTSGLVRDAATDTRLVLDDDGTLVALGVVYSPPAGGHRLFAGGGVDAGHRRRGLGREMFEWQLARAADVHAAAGSPDGWVVESSSDVRDAGRIALYEHHGFKPVRWWRHMEIDPARVTPAALPPGISAAPYRESDLDALYHASEEAFADHYGHEARSRAEWYAMMIDDEAYRPEYSLVARDGDEVVAFTMTYAMPRGALLVGEVGTRVPWRRRGIAGALLSETLVRAAAGGVPSAFLDVDTDNADGAAHVYERVGFRATDRRATYLRTM